jgi:hypothetical protein
VDTNQPKNPDLSSYLRLIGVYESDVQVENKWIHCFLLTMETVVGHKFLCPVYVEPNYVENTKKCLSRLVPLLYAPTDGTDDLRKDAQTIEMTEVVAHTIVDEDTQMH